MGHHTEEEVMQLITEADTDGNQEIDFDEFLQFIINHMPGKPDPVKECRLVQPKKRRDLSHI